ncbi:glycosyltransferase [Pedobacter nanyangensis]|uniref:glycosyltransferase n=1 Tax=Pedobacter nanyangensis TaxID=1562389 RepID=UPI001F068793|nr:glycosyltransferase [Pedobacter nanyangensis]
MKIALTVDPEIAVPPLHYGGIERIVDFLVTEYLRKGHQVFLFANENSRNDCELKIWPGKNSQNKLDTLKNTVFLTKEHLIHRFDIVHSFSRLAYLGLILPFGAKCIMSYQREPTISQIKKINKLAFWKNLHFTGCSDYISDQIKPFAPTTTVYNGVDLKKFDFAPTAENNSPLVFLGRIEPIKGTHNAIKLAKASRKKLIIAGNIPSEYQWYFKEEVEPHLDADITYMGSVDDRQKNILLQNALAFLMPIEWNEPFGIVMAEAMACGTPVIGTSKGAVNEVVIDGVNGFKHANVDSLVHAINNIEKISRSNVRKDAEERFSSTAIAEKYLMLYKSHYQYRII